MEKKELIEKLKLLVRIGDPEAAHGNADDLLIEYINDLEVKDAFDEIEKWYA